jgi:hypothetical protein
MIFSEGESEPTPPPPTAEGSQPAAPESRRPKLTVVK